MGYYKNHPNPYTKVLDEVREKFKDWKKLNEYYSQGEMTWNFRKGDFVVTVSVQDWKTFNE